MYTTQWENVHMFSQTLQVFLAFLGGKHHCFSCIKNVATFFWPRINILFLTERWVTSTVVPAPQWAADPGGCHWVSLPQKNPGSPTLSMPLQKGGHHVINLRIIVTLLDRIFKHCKITSHQHWRADRGKIEFVFGSNSMFLGFWNDLWQIKPLIYLSHHLKK